MGLDYDFRVGHIADGPRVVRRMQSAFTELAPRAAGADLAGGACSGIRICTHKSGQASQTVSRDTVLESSQLHGCNLHGRKASLDDWDAVKGMFSQSSPESTEVCCLFYE